ncbi:MAG: NAD(P)/FAD-dependent oxidoreductase, partial [Candidatus Eisenbacteria bacterium]|nr:NAD(P)/FAD-dependent oxidoreductase [Candidatus Eisenbacteria bacterium]
PARTIGIACVREEVMHDVIIVGARCAGSPTAMLLARKGYRVLLVDKARFPSDTLSAHYIHQPGIASLHRWGLLDKVVASGCPPIERQVFDVGPLALTGVPPPAGGITAGYAPRRTILDKILIDAAADAGAEVREHFSVEELVTDGDRVTGIRGRSSGGDLREEEARIVVGADGMRSAIARMVGAPVYNEQPASSCAYYSYWSDVSIQAVELYPRPESMVIAAPTNDGLTMTIVYWPESAFQMVRADIEGEFMKAVDMIPDLARRIRAGSRAEKFRGAAELHGFFRRPHGPGWALVGDAGYHKNPITALGITDAFRDAELLADALDVSFSGRRSTEEALAGYERQRNEAVMPLYQMTCDLARLEPPPPEMQSLFAALQNDEVQSGRFMGTIAGTVPIPKFFSPENIGRIMAAAG